jgi:DNA-3-methyladenine glycosylase II
MKMIIIYGKTLLMKIEWRMVMIHLTVPEEFNYKENLKYLERSSNECLYQVKEGRIYKALYLDGETAMIEISEHHEKGLAIRFLNEAPQETQTAVVQYVREWFDLDRDLSPFYMLAQNDSLLGSAVERFYGLRIIGIPDLFEAISWGILGQQINLTYAYTLKRRLVESFGKSIDHDGEPYWLFPTAKEIAALKIEDLDGLRMTVKKSEYLIGIAKLIDSGELTTERLLEAGSLQAAEKILVSIRGIGPWTANYVLMRCLRYTSAFPIDDVGLHNAIKLQLQLDRKPTKDEIRKLANHWTNWEAYATFYLWRFLY